MITEIVYVILLGITIYGLIYIMSYFKSKNETLVILDEEDDFSLLLLHVSYIDDSSGRKIIVGVKTEKVNELLGKSRITAVDIEMNEIIRIFGENELIEKDDIASAKNHFHGYFLRNEKMRNMSV